MPSTDWNKKWATDLKRFNKTKKDEVYYGHNWGDPGRKRGVFYRLSNKILQKEPGDLSKVVSKYISPYVQKDSIVLEIGSGGGRWTSYLLKAKEIIIVELNPEFFDYLKKRFRKNISKINFYKTSGYNLDGIQSDYVDFIFTFGVFVHTDPEGIFEYLKNIKRVLKPSGVAVIQYSDKTKKFGKMNKSFSNMNPKKMEGFVSKYKFKILDHNTRLLNHSSIIMIQK